MMDCTDRFFRFVLRRITARTLLYTEMVTTGAILRGDRDRFLGYDASEHPLALQLGGSDPAALADCARIAEDYGYAEVNLNVGCPSDRVRSGRFGACLMAEPELVADGVAAMRAAVSIPVTVKTRIGVDDRDSWDHLAGFVSTVAAAGCRSFAIHARKAWLSGLSPKENREVPPLRYDVAARLKAGFPALEIVLNGGVGSLDEAVSHLETFDGVMIGRAAARDPMMLAEADVRVFGAAPSPVPDLADIVEAYLPALEAGRVAGAPNSRLVAPLMNLMHGRPGGRVWRRRLSEAGRAGADAPAVIRAALAGVTDRVDDIDRDGRTDRAIAA